MDEEAEGERELGLALLKFVMESSVLGRRDGGGWGIGNIACFTSICSAD